MASIPSGKSTLSDGKVPQPWWWWTWCTGWRLPRDHWPDSWGLLRLNPWISQVPLEEMTANTAENRHVYLEFFRKKWRAELGFLSEKKRILLGLKKKRSTKKTKVEGKKTKQIPSKNFHLECKWTLDNLGEPFPVSIHILKGQLFAKIIWLQHLAKVEITSSGYWVRAHSRREAISGHKKPDLGLIQLLRRSEILCHYRQSRKSTRSTMSMNVVTHRKTTQNIYGSSWNSPVLRFKDPLLTETSLVSNKHLLIPTHEAGILLLMAIFAGVDSFVKLCYSCVSYF